MQYVGVITNKANEKMMVRKNNDQIQITIVEKGIEFNLAVNEFNQMVNALDSELKTFADIKNEFKTEITE